MMSGAPEGSLLDPALFDILIRDTDSGMECTVNKFAGDTKLGSAVDTTEGRDVI